MSTRTSIFTKLAKEVGELSDDAVRALRRVLPKNATVAQAKDAYERIMRELPEEIDFAAKPAAPAVIRNRTGTPRATAQDVLREAEKPSKGSPSYADWRVKNPESGKLFDMSRLSAVPNVPQTQMARTVPPRGPSERIVEALSRPEVEQGINETVQRGVAGGGPEWYNTEPMRERLFAITPETEAADTYANLMDIVAATSPRARVPDNIRTASYYNYLKAQGMPVPDKPAKGYGSVAQNLHRENVLGLEERGGWDVFKNPKPASFSTNLQGNQRNVTIDTHNFRLPGILARDPRFLETSIAELSPSYESALEGLRRNYPNLPQDVAQAAIKPKGEKVSVTYRPREWYDRGYMTMDEAANDPAIWTAKPNPNEYGYYEQWQQDQAAKMGLSPAQYQASMWLGGGDTTGLGSAAEPFLGTMEARVRYTADRLGMDPDVVLEMMLKGEIPLLAEGGAVDREKLAVKRKKPKAAKAQGSAFAARPPKGR